MSILILMTLTLILSGPESLSNLRVSVPSIVLRGETTSFNCSWDMEPIDKVIGMMIVMVMMKVILMRMRVVVMIIMMVMISITGVGSEVVPWQF